jgi:hypothetical protein
MIGQASHSERLTMFRFSIREVLWLMLALGIGLGWWRNRTEYQAERSAYQQERSVLMRSHEKVQEIRQMLGDQGVDRLVDMARDYNQAPVLPNTLIISMRDRSGRPRTTLSANSP